MVTSKNMYIPETLLSLFWLEFVVLRINIKLGYILMYHSHIDCLVSNKEVLHNFHVWSLWRLLKLFQGRQCCFQVYQSRIYTLFPSLQCLELWQAPICTSLCIRGSLLRQFNAWSSFVATLLVALVVEWLRGRGIVCPIFPTLRL